MQTVMALAMHPMMEFSMSFAGRLDVAERTLFICSNKVQVRPYTYDDKDEQIILTNVMQRP